MFMTPIGAALCSVNAFGFNDDQKDLLFFIENGLVCLCRVISAVNRHLSGLHCIRDGGYLQNSLRDPAAVDKVWGISNKNENPAV